MGMLSVEATFIVIFVLFKLRKMGKLSGKTTVTFDDSYYFYICLIYIKVHFQGRGGRVQAEGGFIYFDYSFT